MWLQLICLWLICQSTPQDLSSWSSQGCRARSRPQHASQDSSAQRRGDQKRHFQQSSGHHRRASREAVCRASHFQELSLQLGLGHAKNCYHVLSTIQLSELPMAITAEPVCQCPWQTIAHLFLQSQPQHSQQLFPKRFPVAPARFESWVCTASICLMSQTQAQTRTPPSSWRYSHSTRSPERA